MKYLLSEGDFDELEYLCEMVMYLNKAAKRTREEDFIFESISFRLGAVLDRLEKSPTDEDYLAALGPCGK